MNGSEAILFLIIEKRQREARHAGVPLDSFPRKPPARLLQTHWEKGSHPGETDTCAAKLG